MFLLRSKKLKKFSDIIRLPRSPVTMLGVAKDGVVLQLEVHVHVARVLEYNSLRLRVNVSDSVPRKAPSAKTPTTSPKISQEIYGQSRLLNAARRDNASNIFATAYIDLTSAISNSTNNATEPTSRLGAYAKSAINARAQPGQSHTFDKRGNVFKNEDEFGVEPRYTAVRVRDYSKNKLTTTAKVVKAVNKIIKKIPKNLAKNSFYLLYYVTDLGVDPMSMFDASFPVIPPDAAAKGIIPSSRCSNMGYCATPREELIVRTHTHNIDVGIPLLNTTEIGIGNMAMSMVKSFTGVDKAVLDKGGLYFELSDVNPDYIPLRKAIKIDLITLQKKPRLVFDLRILNSNGSVLAKSELDIPSSTLLESIRVPEKAPRIGLIPKGFKSTIVHVFSHR